MSSEDDSSVAYCKSCREQLHPPTARYCSNCGDPQQEIEKRPCILCQYPLPTTSQECVLCSAPQDPQMFHQTDKKKCTNPECRAQLIMTSSKCYNCTMDQPHQQHLSYNQNKLKWDRYQFHCGSLMINLMKYILDLAVIPLANINVMLDQ